MQEELDPKIADAKLLAVQTSGVSSLNSVWREKARIFVKSSLVEQSKRLRRCAYGKVLNADATMAVVATDMDGKKVEKTIFANVPRDFAIDPVALKTALERIATQSKD